MQPRKKLLFVDDDEAIRLTLPLILRKEGFEVSVASTVCDALAMIQRERFDILLSDLNIGQPGDGFTVVSAMRRSQPQAATVILTGYPDFDTALRAIRNQVDDYLTKPADVPKLVATLKETSSSARQPHRTVPRKRISTIIRENAMEILRRWVSAVEANPELSSVKLSRPAKENHFARLILEVADSIERKNASEAAIKAAREHGRQRFHNGYTIPMLLVEASILEKTVACFLQEQLLAIDISTLIDDMALMSLAINCAAETSVRAFLELSQHPTAAA